MKILHIHPSKKMSERFILPLILAEKYMGYQSSIINFNNDEITQNENCFNLNFNNLGLIFQSFKFMAFIKKLKPDIVFCHNSLQAIVPLILLKFLRIPNIIYFNHGVTFLGYKGIKRLIFYTIEKINLSLAKKTLTVSNEMKFHLDKLSSNVSIINNGSACGISIDNVKKRKIYQDYLLNDNLTISYIGRLQERKGIKVLIKILDYFKDSKRVNFTFCGFSNHEFYQFSGKKFSNLQCLGFINNVSDILYKTDILLLPSLHEGMPYSILEGMLNGTLIIANDIPGTRSLIKNMHNGILVKNNDPNLYISIISKIFLRKIGFKKLINNSFKDLKKYDRTLFLTEYQKFLRNI